MTEETCFDGIDLSEETLMDLVHLVDEGYKGAEEELKKRLNTK